MGHKNCVSKTQSSTEVTKDQIFYGPWAVFRSQQKSIEKRLMKESELNLPNFIRVAYCEILPDNVHCDLTYGDQYVRHLCSRFKADGVNRIGYFENVLQIKVFFQPLSIYKDEPIFFQFHPRNVKEYFHRRYWQPYRTALLTIHVPALKYIRKVGGSLIQRSATS